VSDQDIAAEVPRNIAVFALPLPQSVQMLSAVVHDKTQLDEIRRKTARLLIPHLQVELARLREERACARTGTLRECEHEREVIGWT
jgi:hypothetical protein